MMQSPAAARETPGGSGGDRALTTDEPSFRDRFTDLFGRQFPRIHRYLTRLSGEPDLAADLAQEAFARLYARGSLPDKPEAWIITVSTNLFRNERSKRGRRLARLTRHRARRSHSEPSATPAELVSANEVRAEVRRALESLPPREREMLLLRAEGYAYREIAAALGVHDASVGTLLARARRAFLEAYRDVPHAR